MCQIFIIKRNKFIKNQLEYENHLELGALANDHGYAALFITKNGSHSLIRCMDFDIIHNMMVLNYDWDQVIIHQRFTTQGAANIANSHMWQVGSYFYCHNGVMKDAASIEYEVDSQLIGYHLEDDSIWDAIAYCQSEPYANVFIANMEKKKIWVSRSKDNTLFTDGNGQYSTKELVGEIDIPVPVGSVTTLDLNIEDHNKWGCDYNYEDWSYEQKVSNSTYGNDTVDEIPADKADHVALVDSPFTTNINEIEVDVLGGEVVGLDDIIEIEQALHKAVADGDTFGERRYNYLLEKANGNG